MIKKSLKKLFDLFKINIFNNFFYLILLQATNFIFPLLLIPYLVKTIGYDKVGMVFFAQSLMSYFIMLTEYGFNYTATQQISINRNDKGKIAEIVNSVVVTKFLLLSISLIILLFLIYFVKIFYSSKSLFFLSFSIVVGQTFTPNWFFQGLEKMKFIAILSFIGKLSFLLMIYFFVKKGDRYIYVNLYVGIGYLIVAILMNFLMYKEIKFFIEISLSNIRNQLKEGWLIFVSGFAINIYISSNIFILGFYVNKTTLGYYSIAEKCYLAIRSLLGIFSQVIYPRVCNIALTGTNNLILFYKKIMPYFLILISFCSLIFFLLTPFIVYLFSHAKKEEIIFLTRAFTFLPLIIALNIPVNQIIIINKLKKSYGAILIFASLLNIICNIFFAKFYGAIGTISSIYLTELFVTTGMYTIIEIRYKHLSLFSKKTD